MRNKFTDGGTVRFLPDTTPLIHQYDIHQYDMTDHIPALRVCPAGHVADHPPRELCDVRVIDTASGELITLRLNYKPYKTIIDYADAYARMVVMEWARIALLSRIHSIRGQQHLRRRRGF